MISDCLFRNPASGRRSLRPAAASPEYPWMVTTLSIRPRARMAPIPMARRHASFRSIAASTAIFLAVLACCAGTSRAQYVLMRGNLHAHTDYSDDKSSDLSTINPFSAAQAAQAAGLNVFSSTDHGEYLSEDVWASTKSEAKDATQPKQGFVSLWGFEWTSSKDGSPTSATGLGHINVYGSPRRAGMGPNTGVPLGTPTDWVRRVWWTNPSAQQPTQGSLYRWILDNGVSPIDSGRIVGQFNHPSGMPLVSLANPSSRVTEGEQVLVADWWRKLEWVEPLDPYMTLMEVSGRTLSGTQTPLSQSMMWNEPYYQLALDNGWHIGPTNNEDNHFDSYGYEAALTNEGAQVFISTGIWAQAVTDLPVSDTGRQQAQGRVMEALRARRTFAAEYRTGLVPAAHRDGTSLKFTVSTVADGVKWMGDRTLKPQDLDGTRCRVEVKPGKNLTLSRVEVVTNRGVVAKSLPVAGTGVTWTNGVASWDFGLPGDTPGAQIRVCSNTAYTTGAYANLPLAPTWHGTSRTVVLNASPSGRIERYHYVRVLQVDSTGKPYWAIGAPVWVERTRRTPVSYRWEFGDGTAPQTVAVPANPAPDTVYSEVQHAYGGTATVFHPRVTVNYSDGTSESAITRVVFGAAPTTPLYGDANGDGQINREDVSLLSRFASGLQGVADVAQFDRCNVNPAASGGAPGGTTKLDIADLLRLERFLAGTLHSGSAIPVWP